MSSFVAPAEAPAKRPRPAAAATSQVEVTSSARVHPPGGRGLGNALAVAGQQARVGDDAQNIVDAAQGLLRDNEAGDNMAGQRDRLQGVIGAVKQMEADGGGPTADAEAFEIEADDCAATAKMDLFDDLCKGEFPAADFEWEWPCDVQRVIVKAPEEGAAGEAAAGEAPAAGEAAPAEGAAEAPPAEAEPAAALLQEGAAAARRGGGSSKPAKAAKAKRGAKVGRGLGNTNTEMEVVEAGSARHQELMRSPGVERFMRLEADLRRFACPLAPRNEGDLISPGAETNEDKLCFTEGMKNLQGVICNVDSLLVRSDGKYICEEVRDKYIAGELAKSPNWLDGFKFSMNQFLGCMED
eukprot:TRINITY_DN4238_c0_g2_i1.p1 TRINITY_DN4238_c0_g2~~TRINITY_DN4238_c0_g2_i1.p1  ORF type:complete len:390 (+),score=109.57 TRINITY_DN4238_c0_g2_i1:111-1172(+)